MLDNEHHKITWWIQWGNVIVVVNFVSSATSRKVDDAILFRTDPAYDSRQEQDARLFPMIISLFYSRKEKSKRKQKTKQMWGVLLWCVVIGVKTEIARKVKLHIEDKGGEENHEQEREERS